MAKKPNKELTDKAKELGIDPEGMTESGLQFAIEDAESRAKTAERLQGPPTMDSNASMDSHAAEGNTPDKGKVKKAPPVDDRPLDVQIQEAAQEAMDAIHQQSQPQAKPIHDEDYERLRLQELKLCRDRLKADATKGTLEPEIRIALQLKVQALVNKTWIPGVPVKAPTTKLEARSANRYFSMNVPAGSQLVMS